MFPVSIRYGIPLLIVVFTAVLAAYTTQKEWGTAEAVVRGEAVSQMISRITLLQKQLGYSYATGDHERIAQETSLLGSAPEPQIAILADDTHVEQYGARPDNYEITYIMHNQQPWAKRSDKPCLVTYNPVHPINPRKVVAREWFNFWGRGMFGPSFREVREGERAPVHPASESLGSAASAGAG